MVRDGTEDGVLGLLQSKLESWRWLAIRDASKVLDAVPCDRVEPLEVHDLFVQSKCFFTAEQALVVICRSRSGGLIRFRRSGKENL